MTTIPEHHVSFQSSFFIGGPDHDLHAGWFIGAGIVLLVLGALALAYPMGLTLASSVLMGLLLVGGGVMELMQGFVYSGFSKGAHRRAVRWEAILMGICLLISGLLMTMQPVAGSVFVTAFLGTLFIFAGIGRLFWVVRHRHALGRFGLFLSAIITLGLGILLFVTLPYSSMVFLGTLIAIELLILGFSALAFGVGLRKWQHNNKI